MRESFAKARSWWSKPSKIHGISKRKSLPSWDEWYDWKSFFCQCFFCGAVWTMSAMGAGWVFFFLGGPRKLPSWRSKTAGCFRLQIQAHVRNTRAYMPTVPLCCHDAMVSNSEALVSSASSSSSSVAQISIKCWACCSKIPNIFSSATMICQDPKQDFHMVLRQPWSKYIKMPSSKHSEGEDEYINIIQLSGPKIFFTPQYLSIYHEILGGKKKQQKTGTFSNQVASGLTIMIVKTLPKSWVIPIMMPTITMTSATSIKALGVQISSLHQDLPFFDFFWGGRKGHGKTSKLFWRTYVWWAVCRRFMLWTNIKCIYLHVGFNFLFESTYTHLHTDDTYHTHTHIQLCRYICIYTYIYFLYTYRIY